MQQKYYTIPIEILAKIEPVAQNRQTCLTSPPRLSQLHTHYGPQKRHKIIYTSEWHRLQHPDRKIQTENHNELVLYDTKADLKIQPPQSCIMLHSIWFNFEATSRVQFHTLYYIFDLNIFVLEFFLSLLFIYATCMQTKSLQPILRHFFLYLANLQIGPNAVWYHCAEL